MRRVVNYTVDEAFISFRYAHNFSSGNGLVYNVGDRVEGYASFFWTILLAITREFGADPETVAKIVGAASALGVLWLVYRLAQRLTGSSTFPCVATWFLASSAALSGHAVTGTEIAAFTFLSFFATVSMFEESERSDAFPWSGLLFAVAMLTRPEALLFLVAPTLLLGRRAFRRQSLIRWGLFLGPVLLHLGFRLAYYGEWLSRPLASRLTISWDRFQQGFWYLDKYFDHPGAPVVLALFLIVWGIVKRDRLISSLALSAALYLLYVIALGGDWMWRHRMVVPVEPFMFVLAGVAARKLIGSRWAVVAGLAVAGTLVGLSWQLRYLRSADDRTNNMEQHFWDEISPRFVNYLIYNTDRGLIAMSDGGRIGYYTQYPVLDLLGDLDSGLADLPRGYDGKTGNAYARAVLDARPEYVILEAGETCQHIGNRRHGLILGHPAFMEAYEDVLAVGWGGRRTWCLFEHRLPEPQPREAQAPERAKVPPLPPPRTKRKP